MKQGVNLFWFRRDLRLHDNVGLHHALKAGLPVVPLFIFDKTILQELQDQDDRRVSFIYKAIQEMQEALQQAGSTMEVRYGFLKEIFQQLTTEYDIHAVFTNHDYEPYARQRDEAIKEWLSQQGISFHTFKDQVIFEKSEVVKDNGEPYTVYTPYYKKWANKLTPQAYQPYGSEQLLQHFYQQAPRPMPALSDMGFQSNWDIPGVSLPEEAIIKNYHLTRNTPAVAGTSRMGVHLRFGTISVRQLVQKAIPLNETFLKELVWREFFMQLLWHRPHLVQHACRPEYDAIEWQNNEAHFSRWCLGQTGYSIVDAGMRKLNATGFMHNRVRMIAASFLVKDLLIDWRWGEAYFAQKLLDYELASNNGNWQWVAGCGCDAAPYFRIFNPALQAQKFDKKGLYIKKWVPEYGTFDYPQPIVDHQQAAARCLQAYKKALAARQSPPLSL